MSNPIYLANTKYTQQSVLNWKAKTTGFDTGQCGGRARRGKVVSCEKPFSAQLLTKFGVKLPNLRRVPSFPVVLPQRPQTLVATTCKMSFHKVFPTQEVNCEGNKSNVHFIKLHAPWPLLCRFVQLQQSNLWNVKQLPNFCRFAEELNLRAPIQVPQNKPSYQRSVSIFTSIPTNPNFPFGLTLNNQTSFYQR